jgi:hypothetical protein
LGIGLAAAIDPADYATAAEYDRAYDEVLNQVSALGLLGWLLAYALLAPKVSYRWFDAFCLLVPIYSWVWQFRIAWRVSNLPYRDWAPRPDELRHAAGVGGWSPAPMSGVAGAPVRDQFTWPSTRS